MPTHKFFRIVPGMYSRSIVMVISSSSTTLAVNSTTTDLLLYTKLSDRETEIAYEGWRVIEKEG